MRGLPSTIALLVALIALGSYAYFVTSKSDDTSTKQDKLFAGLDAAQIEELKVKSESGDVTSLKKEGGVWKIVSPLETAAGETDATGIANALADIDVVRVVEENPNDVKDYGLDQPRIEIEYKGAGGKPGGRLFVGSKTATGGSLYARRDDQKRVILIGQYHESTLNKSTFDLRDKAILKIDRSKIDGVEINAIGKTIEIGKAGQEWTLISPLKARADLSAVEGLITRLETAQMKSVVTAAPTPADLKKYGFDKPQATVTFHLGSARASALIGAKADDTTVYVRDSSRPDVFTVDASTADDVKKTPIDYRRKEVFDFRAYTATRIELTRNGQAIVFERVKAKEDSAPDTWRRVSPNAGDATREKVESLLTGLADIRATSFVDGKGKTGLDAPVLTVLAKFEDGQKEERVTFAKKGVEVFASRTDDPGAAQVDASKLDDTLKALDELTK